MPDVQQRALSPWCLLATALAGAALAGATFAGEVATAMVLALTGLVAAYGWPRILDLPSPRGVQAVLAFAAVAGAGAALIGDGRDLRWLAVALAATLVGSFMHQLLRKDGRARLVSTLGGTVLGAGLIASGACFIGARNQDDGALLATAALVGVVVLTLVDGLLAPRRGVEWVLPLAAGVSSAISAGAMVLADGPVLGAFAVSFAACVVAHACRRLLTVSPTASRAVAQAAIGAVTVLSVGAVPYVGAWLVEWFTAR
ncbi:hypothetical protein [Demetria terragena]|uniref:hypothetical protein n=1 Tax=Demetria terragena TaxID=63959 RepID=UPI00036D3F09|nr:hypothetical protein [Demetria terragena]